MTKNKNKSTNYEAAKRRDIIRELLVKAWSRGQIVEYCTKKWNCSERNIDKYLKSIKDEWQKDFDDSRNTQRQELLERYRYIYRKALESGDLSLAAKVNKDEAKLLGLEIDKMEVDSKSDVQINISIEGE